MSPTYKSCPDRHVAVLVFPFGSHPMPLLNLVAKLAHEAQDIRFSFFNTAKSNNLLFQAAKRSKSLPNNIEAYDVEDGVPTDHVLSASRPLEAVELFLKTAPEEFKRSLDIAVTKTGKKITCLLTDAFLTFSGDIAKHLNVPWIAVWLAWPCSLSAHLYTALIRDRCASSSSNCNNDTTLDFIPGLSVVKVQDLPDEVMSEELQESLFSQALSQTGVILPRESTGLVLNFYKELNPSDLNQHLDSKLRNVLNVGFLTLSPDPSVQAVDPPGCISWLDEQKASGRPVAYISFGTVAALPSREIIAVAEALEESKISFLWSLKDHLKTDLLQGFEKRTSGQGKIVPWAPQTQVLAHDSVRVFVTHCGCNSVYESIANGVPMICRPFFGDQHMTGRMVEDVWRIGVKVDGGMLTKAGLLKSLDLILRQEQGKMMRERARELKEIVLEAGGPGGSAARDFKNLVGLVSTS